VIKQRKGVHGSDAPGNGSWWVPDEQPGSSIIEERHAEKV